MQGLPLYETLISHVINISFGLNMSGGFVILMDIVFLWERDKSMLDLNYDW